MADDPLRDLVLDALQPLGVRSRAMFGGHGLYHGDKFFGMVVDGNVYFRTDEARRQDYLDRGMPALQPPPGRPRGRKTVDRNFQLPADVLEDQEQLQAWAERASQAP